MFYMNYEEPKFSVEMSFRAYNLPIYVNIIDVYPFELQSNSYGVSSTQNKHSTIKIGRYNLYWNCFSCSIYSVF